MLSPSKGVQVLAVSILFIMGHIAGPSFVLSQTPRDLTACKTISERNIFRPLWKISPETADAVSRKEECEALKKAEAERKEAQKKIDEQNALAGKKKEFEQNYVLTGIVFETGRKQAILQDRKGQTHFLYENDSVGDGIVSCIDDSRGEITIDYQSRFTVIFRLEQ
jgi:hypothetical protein